MKRRSWLVATLILLAVLVGLDTAVWMLATNALRDGIEAWALRQRAAGTSVSLDRPVAGGWPWRASVRYDIRLGPAGLPAGVTVQATLTSFLLPSQPRRLRTDIGQARLIDQDGAAVVATARAWTVDATLGEPDHAVMRASELVLDWDGRDAHVASLDGELNGGRLLLRARDVDLARSGLAMPPAMGATVASIDADAELRGGLPPVAATAADSARAWREAGGAVQLGALTVRYGPLDATAQGRFDLDGSLRPAGSGVIRARGLVALLDALGAAGTIPPRTGQAASGVLALLGDAGDAGDPASGVELPFTLADGRATVAGFPLLRLPNPPWEPR